MCSQIAALHDAAKKLRSQQTRLQVSTKRGETASSLTPTVTGAGDSRRCVSVCVCVYMCACVPTGHGRGPQAVSEKMFQELEQARRDLEQARTELEQVQRELATTQEQVKGAVPQGRITDSEGLVTFVLAGSVLIVCFVCFVCARVSTVGVGEGASPDGVFRVCRVSVTVCESNGAQLETLGKYLFVCRVASV